MTLTALQERLQGDPNRKIRLGEYRGAATATSFGDVQSELATLRTGCSVYDLGFRAKLSVSGRDRVRWLNGMVSNNIRDLAAGHGVYAFLLNPQGRILGDLYAYNHGGSFLIDTDQSQVENILAIFKRYIIMDKVDIANLRERLTAIGVAGPKSKEVLRAAGIGIPELAALQFVTPQCKCECECVECTVVRSDAAREAYEIWIAPDSARKVWDALLSAEASPVGCEALEQDRIALGIPVYGVDIRERDLPQETGQTRALSFTKGCYIGQEIVERIRSRGNVHRQFTGFLVESGATTSPGTKIVAGEKEVGEITSAAVLETREGPRTIALGYIRREAGEAGREVMIGGEKAAVAEMPLGDAAVMAKERAVAR
jgi:folate-binding protein YgfZ